MFLLRKCSSENGRFSKGKLISSFMFLIFLISSIIPLSNVEAEGDTITITNPTNGEKLIAGSQEYITWEVSGSDGYIVIYLSTTGGRSFEHVKTIENNPAMGVGIYQWDIPPNINSTHCKMKLIWSNNQFEPFDKVAEFEMNDTFTIEPGVTMHLTKQPGQVSYGRYYSLEWNLYDPYEMVSGLVFEWRTDNGSGWSSWGSISPYFDWYDTGRSYIWWTPPFYETGTAQIRCRAMSAGNSTILDEFTTSNIQIISPFIVITYPIGGETLVAGDSITIEWRTSSDPQEVINGVRIEYTLNEGSSWNYIDLGANDFSEDWTVPSISTTSMKIRISAYYGEFDIYATATTGDITVIANSNIPSVSLVNPNPPMDGGVVMGSGETYQIFWLLTGYSTITGLKLEYSTDNGSSYNLIVYYLDSWATPFNWDVPEVDTYQGRIRVTITATGYPDKVAVSSHAFYIFDTIKFNRPPVAMAGPDQNVTEGTVVRLNGLSSYDQDGDTLYYDWKQVSPSQITAPLQFTGSSQPLFIMDLNMYPVTFVFELEVSDRINHTVPILFNTDRVSITVNPRPPRLTSVSPDTAWKGTEITIAGSDLMGAEVLINGEMIATVTTTPHPENPDPDSVYNFTLYDVLPNGTQDITVRNSMGEDTITDAIEIYPEPIWQYENGIGFQNKGTNTYSYPWAPWNDGIYKDVFGNQVYLTAWVCIGIPVWTPWTGWECLGYEIEEPFAPDPLAAAFYGAVFHYIGREGECFGMSKMALEHYHGDLDRYDFDGGSSTFWEDFQRSGDFHHYIKKAQGSQMSSEVLGNYLHTLVNSLAPSTPFSGMGLWVARMKNLIDTGELGIATMICDEGAHAVVPYAYEDRDGKTYFYVYDSNREEYSFEDTAPDQAVSGPSSNDNPPVLVIDRTGNWWDWSFEWTDGTIWSDDIGLGMVDYDNLRKGNTLPTSVEGIIDILTGSATLSIENEQGNRSGIAEDGSLQWGIPGAAPLPTFGGAGDKPTGYYLPDGNYTTHISGTEDGKYNWTGINNGSSGFTIEDADVKDGSNDHLMIHYHDGNPYMGEMIYSSDDELKEYNASVIHTYGPRHRTFKIIDAELNDDGENGGGQHLITVSGDYNGIVFENLGGGPTTFDVQFQTNVMSEEVWNGSERPGPGYLPTAIRKGITVGPGEMVIISPSDWLDLNNSIVILEGETPPGIPLDLVISEVDGQIELTWGPPENDGGWPVIEYQIFRSNESGVMELIGETNSTFFLDDTAERGVEYNYSVRAFNVMGPGEFSPNGTVMIPLLTPPSPPINLAVIHQDGKVVISWDEPEDDGGSPLTGYVIFKGTTTGNLAQLAEPGLVTEFEDNDLQPGQTYYYQVAALNEFGQGAFGLEEKVTIPDDQPPPDDDDDTDDDDDEEEDDDDSNYSWIIFLIIGIVVVLLIVVILVFISSRGKGDEEYEE
jgi:hypothetical protein